MSGIIFTDGACSGNPGPGGWASIVAFNGQVIELGGSDSATTNNRMEMLASIRALQYASSADMPFIVYTDSKYVIDGVTKWSHQWRRNGWKTGAGDEVKNRDLWMELIESAQALKLTWVYVAGHSGIPGNERVDELAVAFSKNENVELFEGPLKDYPVSLEVSPTPVSKGVKIEPYYLSYVDSQIFRDKTWDQCKARVSGRRGAKYKKIKNTQEEADTLKLWGLASR
jgi:ribonuclease HI